MNPVILVRCSIIVLAGLVLASCQSRPTPLAHTPTSEVIYRSAKMAPHTDPAGDVAVACTRKPEREGAGSRCLHPVAQGLCVAGRVALLPLFVAAGIYGGPEATANGVEKLLSEPLP